MRAEARRIDAGDAHPRIDQWGGAIGAMQRLPQRLVNVTVRDRGALERADAVHAATRRAEQSLTGRGRVLIRASGTEPLVRVMVEAPSDEEAERVCGELVAVVERELA